MALTADPAAPTPIRCAGALLFFCADTIGIKQILFLQHNGIWCSLLLMLLFVVFLLFPDQVPLEPSAFGTPRYSRENYFDTERRVLTLCKHHRRFKALTQQQIALFGDSTWLDMFVIHCTHVCFAAAKEFLSAAFVAIL